MNELSDGIAPHLLGLEQAGRAEGGVEMKPGSSLYLEQ